MSDNDDFSSGVIEPDQQYKQEDQISKVAGKKTKTKVPGSAIPGIPGSNKLSAAANAGPSIVDPAKRQKQPTFVAAIGASAGGLQPLEDFFGAMPSNTGIAFVVVQHLSPDFKSLMHELLAKHTSMPVSYTHLTLPTICSV